MNISCFIRRTAPQDAKAIIASVEAICAEGLYFVTDRFLSDTQWEAVLYRPETVPDHLLIIAEVNGGLVGCGNLFPGPEGRKDRHVANLGLHVLQPFRRRGIGTQMMAWMLDWAINAGLKKITLSVLASNKPAVALYQKFSFVEEGRRRCQFKVGDTYVDEILMARFLARRLL